MIIARSPFFYPTSSEWFHSPRFLYMCSNPFCLGDYLCTDKALGTGIVRSARIVSCMRAIPVVACASVSRLARMRANGVGNAHAHYYLHA